MASISFSQGHETTSGRHQPALGLTTRKTYDRAAPSGPTRMYRRPCTINTSAHMIFSRRNQSGICSPAMTITQGQTCMMETAVNMGSIVRAPYQIIPPWMSISAVRTGGVEVVSAYFLNRDLIKPPVRSPRPPLGRHLRRQHRARPRELSSLCYRP